MQTEAQKIAERFKNAQTHNRYEDAATFEALEIECGRTCRNFFKRTDDLRAYTMSDRSVVLFSSNESNREAMCLLHWVDAIA